MPDLLLTFGPAHPRKSEPLFRDCLERVRDGRGHTFLYLVPSRRFAVQIRRRLLFEGGTGVLVAPHILGLTDFLDVLYAFCPEPKAYLPEPYRRVLVEAILRERGPSFAYFRHTRRTPFTGLSLALARFIQELEGAGISPSDLEARLQDLPGLHGAKGRELVAVYQSYQDRLGERWVDSEGMQREIAEHLTPEAFADGFPDVDLAVVEGFDLLSPPLMDILETLFRSVSRSHLLLDYVPERPKCFGHMDGIFHRFRELASEIEMAEPEPDDAPGASLEPWLFTGSAPPVPLDGRIVLLPAPDRAAEVEAIARRIVGLVRETGVKPTRIGVAFRQLDRYAPLVREIFPRYGIPFHLSHGNPLAGSPVVASILAALEVVLDGYSRAALLRLLRLPYIRFAYPTEGGAQVLSAEDLDACARRLPSPSGSHGWLRALGAEIARIETQADRSDGFDTEEIGNARPPNARLEVGRKQLSDLKQGLEALFETLAPLNGEQALETFRDRLRAVIARLQIFCCILNPLHSNAADRPLTPASVERDIRAYRRFQEVLDELAALGPALRQDRFGLRDFVDLLRGALSGVQIAARADEGRSVQVLGVLEASGLLWDTLFLGGLVEGEFPARPPPDIFLEESARSALGLPGGGDRLTADRHLFTRAVCAPRKGLFLHFPLENDGDPLLPSPFVREIEAFAPSASPETSLPEILTRAGLHAHLGRTLVQPLASPETETAAKLALACATVPEVAPSVRSMLRGLTLSDLRSRTGPPGSYEGILDAPGALDLIRRRFTRVYPFSITQLERYAACPFAFFAERILDLLPLPEAEGDLSPIDRGNLIHQILYRFYSERGLGDRFERVRPGNLDAARERLTVIAREEAARLGLEGLFWDQEVARMLRQETETGREGLLPRFLRVEAEDSAPAAPAGFELAFGPTPDPRQRDPRSSPDPLIMHGEGEEVRITGKIDRIDRTDDGRFLVIDYKTGRTLTTVADIESGLSLQLPVYLLAAEHLLRQSGTTEGVAGVYYQVRDPETCGKKGYFGDAAARGEVYLTRERGLLPTDRFRQTLEGARQRVLDYARAVRAGRFPLTRHDPGRVCTYCAYRQSCRIDPQRMRSLDGEVESRK